jgi:hypothetical protein
MLEYVFFQETTRKRFQDFLTEQGLAWTLEPGDLETLVIVDEAGMDDELAERIESVYDDLFALEQSAQDPILPPPTGGDDDGSGVVIKLKDGHRVYAALPPGLIQRLLTVITPEELAALVDAITHAVERPDEHWV